MLVSQAIGRHRFSGCVTILREILGVNAFVATAIDLSQYRIGVLLQNQPTCLEIPRVCIQPRIFHRAVSSNLGGGEGFFSVNGATTLHIGMDLTRQADSRPRRLSELWCVWPLTGGPNSHWEKRRIDASLGFLNSTAFRKEKSRG